MMTLLLFFGEIVTYGFRNSLIYSSRAKQP